MLHDTLGTNQQKHMEKKPHQVRRQNMDIMAWGQRSKSME